MREAEFYCVLGKSQLGRLLACSFVCQEKDVILIEFRGPNSYVTFFEGLRWKQITTLSAASALSAESAPQIDR